MRLSLLSVITAQSIITNVNKSKYVTIGTSSFREDVRQLANRPFGSLGKHIILSKSNYYCKITTANLRRIRLGS